VDTHPSRKSNCGRTTKGECFKDSRGVPAIDHRGRQPLSQRKAVVDLVKESHSAVGGQTNVVEGGGDGPTTDGEEVEL
jgi:hypothetical protein